MISIILILFKVKSALERKIQKLSREIITIKESATQAESLFEENESEKIILESKLKFEIQKLKLPFASITKNSASNQSITSLERSVLDLSIQGDIPDKIDSDIPSFPKNNMKLNSLPEPRPLGSNVKISKFVEYGYSPIKIEESLFKRIDTISGSWDRIFQSPLDLPIEKISTRGRAMQFTCLTAFAILLKHWIGKDKFIIGHSFSIRQHSHYIASESGQIEKQKISTSPYIGPLTSLIPVESTIYIIIIIYR